MQREEPLQSRAKKTVDYIIEAAIQLLDADDVSGFTTNIIAVRAGVSIGTVYRYFPDKSAIIRYLALAEIERVTDGALNVVKSTNAGTPEAFLREVLAVELDAFQGRPKATHNIRILARDDSVLMSDVQKKRWGLAEEVYAKLVKLDPTRFSKLSDAEIVAGCEAYIAALIAMSELNEKTEMDLETRARLALNLFEAFASPNTICASDDLSAELPQK